MLLGIDQPNLSVQKANCNEKISIEHNEPELIFRRSLVCEDSISKSTQTDVDTTKYFTDERGEVNTSNENELVESKTVWKGNSIIITIFHIDSKSGKKKVNYV